MFAWFLNTPLVLETATGILQKKLFLKISQYSQENTYARAFFHKVAGLFRVFALNTSISPYQYLCVSSLNAEKGLQLYQKELPTQVFSCEYY